MEGNLDKEFIDGSIVRPETKPEILDAESKDRSLTPETKESIKPNYTVDIYFGAHGTAEDIEGKESEQTENKKFRRRALIQEFRTADIYIPELHGWTESSLRQLQDLAYGRITPDQLLAEMKDKNFDPAKDGPMIGFKKAEMEMIYKSYKPIVILDVPQEDPRVEVLRQHVFGSKDRADKRRNFNQVLAQIRTELRKTADLHNEREDYMISQLTPKLEEVFKIRPDLRNKPDLKVLMFLGIAHTRIARVLSTYFLRIKLVGVFLILTMAFLKNRFAAATSLAKVG